MQQNTMTGVNYSHVLEMLRCSVFSDDNINIHTKKSNN